MAPTAPLPHPDVIADDDPHRPALTMAGSGATLTYAELRARANQAAHYLRARGLQPGDGIAVLTENRLEYFEAFWAAMRAGLYFTPLSTQLKAPEAAYIIEDSGARALIASAEQLERLAASGGAPNEPEHRLILGPACSGWHAWNDALAGMPETALADACEGATLLYSSGTTGRPKGVLGPEPGKPLGTVGELARHRMALHEIDADTVYLSTAPLYHSAPLRYTEIVLRAGGRCVVMERFDAATALALIERHRITHSQWVPTMFVRLLELPEATRHGHDLSSHRVAVHAAAPCPVAVKRRVLEWWGPIVHEYYSGTEGNGQTAIGPEAWLAHPGSVGRPLVGQVHIVDPESGHERPAGETGLVYFEGGPRFAYLHDPAKTRAAYNRAGWSTLGDLGYMDADGYLYLTDRRDFTIITGGVNIYPREAEEALLTHPQVADAAVFGIPDAEFGEQVKAAVELTPGSEASTALEQALIEHCRARIAHLKCPRSIDFHTRLPRLATGKLEKHRLRAAYR